MSRADKAAATRAKLVETAREMFEANPYWTVTTRAIASAAGFSTGAIFLHWTGKDELYAEAFGHKPITPEQGRELLYAVKAYRNDERAPVGRQVDALIRRIEGREP